MSTNACTAVAFSAQGGRSYSVTATDGTFGNRFVDDVGSAQIGFAQTGELVDRILVTYTAGSCAWRLIDSVSQITLRTGFGALGSFECDFACRVVDRFVRRC